MVRIVISSSPGVVSETWAFRLDLLPALAADSRVGGSRNSDGTTTFR
jgi:hypothetical protein